MLSDIAGLGGRRAARVRLPWRALIPVAFFAEAVANITGREPFATLTGVYMAYVEGIEDAVRWFRDAGYVGS
jgi:dihydroflavonol-4-reductase